VESLQLRKSQKIATIVGATGLVGSFLLKHLEKDAAYSKVYALSRKKPKLVKDSRILWVKLPTDLKLSPKAELSDIECIRTVLPEGNDFFSTLGTTRSKAGSSAAFSAIDFQLNLVLAKAALQKEYSQYFLVSAVGANARSAFLYNKVKGNLELAVKSLPFWSIHIFQPSLLVGSRNENRWGERAAESLLNFSSLFFGKSIRNYQPIEAEQVSLCMLLAARETSGGIRIHTNADMNETAVGQDLKTL